MLILFFVKRIFLSIMLLVFLCQCVSLSQKDQTWQDHQTGLIWYKQGCRNFREHFGGINSLTFFFAQSWISQLNNHKIGDYSDWRLPTIAEYQTVFQEGAGQVLYEHRSAKQMPLGNLGYRPPILGKQPIAWSMDGDNEEAFCFDFLHGEARKYPKDLDMTYEFEALAVRGSLKNGQGKR